VQPLHEGFGPRLGRGFTVFFSLVPLARAEYESPGRSLRSLYHHAGRSPVVQGHLITAAGTSRTVYFVGREIDLGYCASEMELWLHTGGESKQPCWFAESFHASPSEGEITRYWRRPIAWWAMEERFMFTLDESVATKLVDAVHVEATTHAGFGERGWR
jgi:hypothetical protein